MWLVYSKMSEGCFCSLNYHIYSMVRWPECQLTTNFHTHIKNNKEKLRFFHLKHLIIGPHVVALSRYNMLYSLCYVCCPSWSPNWWIRMICCLLKVPYYYHINHQQVTLLIWYWAFDVCVTVHHWYDNMNSQLDATITNFIDNYNQLNMFRAIISPILRSTRLCLQLVV